MKILYIITGLTVGGAERITIDLAERMVKLGNEVTFIYLSGKQELEVLDKIELINLHMRKTPFGFVHALFKAKQIVKVFKPDVVHSNMFHANFLARILRLFVKFPKLICTEHNKNIQSKLRMMLINYSDFLCDITTNVSQEATDYFIEHKAFKKNKSIAVYNGIDLKKYKNKKDLSLRNEYNISENDFLFINVSRLMPQKDHENLIKAFSIVHENNSFTKLICIGDGPKKKDLEQLVNILNLKDSVIFAGNQTEVSKFYNMADCFVLSSTWEGFGIVLAEAMACELPVITTDCGGTKEVVQNDDFIVPPKNSDLLAKKMIEITEIPKLERQKIGICNRELVKKFDLDSVTNKWCDLYKNGI